MKRSGYPLFQGKYFLIGYFIYSLILIIALLTLNRVKINIEHNDELLYLLLVPLGYGPLYFSRTTCYLALGISFCISVSTLWTIDTLAGSFGTVLTMLFVVVFVIETVYRFVAIRRKLEIEKEDLSAELTKSLRTLRRLTEIIPICSICRRIKSDEDSWRDFENFLREELNIEIISGVCEDCVKNVVQELSGETDKKNHEAG